MLTPLLLAAAVGHAAENAIEKVRGNHRTIHTEITIDAPPEAVWAVLTDWERMPEWSPSIQGIQGEVGHGAEVVVDYIHPGNGKLLVLDHTLIYTEGERFGWSDPIIPGVTDHHIFRVEALPDGRTRFVQDDEIRGGLVVRLVGTKTSTMFFDSYVEFNDALKAQVEGEQ